jgi:hypothetical protein
MKLHERRDDTIKLKFYILVLCLFFFVACSNSDVYSKRKPDNILIQFDNKDLVRMNQFISKFHDSKSDYVLAITTTVEGNFIIYDFISNGRNIDISIDYSRDAYSDGKTNSYVCNDASIREEATTEGKKSTLEIMGSSGPESFEKADIITFYE